MWRKKMALGAIRFYQVALSPFWPGSCRHEPSCSRYTHEAISKHGVTKGTWIGVKRLARCRPFGTSGYDPVP